MSAEPRQPEDASTEAIREVAAGLWEHADALQGLEAETLAVLSAIGSALGAEDADGTAPTAASRHAQVFAAHETFRAWATSLDEEATDRDRG